MRTHLSGWTGDRDFLAATLLDHPWADSELPSLVATDDGEIVGAVAAQVRRLRFTDRELRGVCCSHLVVAPGSRSGAAGALLLGRLLRGPQALTWSDSANDPVLRMWRTFGGQTDYTRICEWMLVLRPLRWLGGTASALARRSGRSREVIPVAALPFHALGRRFARERDPPPDPEVSGAEAGAAEIAEQSREISARRRVRVEYDRPFLEYLLPLVGGRIGPLDCRLVRRGDRVIGCYAVVPNRARGLRVIHLSALEREVDAVFAELVQEARRRGAHVLSGRLEPHVEAPVRRRLAVIGLARRPVIHSHDPELLAALQTDAALLTQLDGEWFVA